METNLTFTNYIKIIFIISSSLFIAILLSMLPFPKWLLILRPDIITMVIIFWLIYFPTRIGVGYVCFISVLLDVLNGVPFGSHSIGLMIVSYIALKFHIQIRLIPLWQQAIYVSLLIFIYRSLFAFMIYIERGHFDLSIVTFPLLLSFVFWPWISILLKGYSDSTIHDI